MNNEIARLMQSIIPTGFEHYPQFINYNLVPNPKFPGKFDKKPCNVRGVDIAAFNRANWLTPQQAVANFISGVGHGIGFVFSEYDPFWFIDLDGAFINGSWSDLARRVHERFPGAAFEISQSGKGLHIFGSGEVPEHRKRVKLEGLGELEFYTVGRFVALTGTNKAGDARLDFTAAMPRFIADFGLTPDPAVAEVVIHTAGLAPGAEPYERDGELIQRMKDSTGSQRVAFGEGCHPRYLWDCDVTQLARYFPPAGPGEVFDWSRADLALVANLYFWCGDLARTARLFMASKLARVEKYQARPALMGYMLRRVAGSQKVFHQKSFRSSSPQERTQPPLQLPPPQRTDESARAVGAASWGVQPVNYEAINPGMAATTAAVLRNFNNSRTADDICALEIPPIDWLVDDMVRPGVFLLIGKPKKGKSWMMLDLAVNVSIGGNFMGKLCREASVIYFALEDNDRRMKGRLTDMKAASFTMNAANLRILTITDNVVGMDQGFMEDLRHTLEANPATRLVVIDTLAVIRFRKKRDAPLYDYDRQSLDVLTKLCADYPNLTIIVVHHSRKSETEDVFDAASGTTGLTGAVDGTFVIAYEQEKGITVLHGVGRDGDPIELAIRFDYPRWMVLGDPADVGSHENQRKIIDHLKSVGVPQKMSEIVDGTGIKKPTVQGLLSTMVKQDKLMREGFLYILRG